MVRVAIISAGYKNKKMSEDFLSHLENSLKSCKAEAHLFWVDACDDVAQDIDKLPHVGWETYNFTVTRIKNKSFSNSMNSGLRLALPGKFDYYLVIGNDGFPQTEGWLDLLIETQVKHGSWITCPEHDKPPLSAYKHNYLFSEGHVQYYKMFPAVCWLIADQVIEELGNFDEQFEVGCYEDDDYCKRVTNAGGHIVVDTRVKLKHLLSQTFGLFDQSKYMVENGKRFKEKHNL